MKDCEQLGKYRIDAILGEGGMGVVYKGWHPNLDKAVAIKTIRRSLLNGREGRELRERFHLEARAAARLNHQNIVSVHDFEEDDEGDPFFVMEFVEGKSLKEFLARGMHFNLEMSLHIISQILNGLSHSHSHGVVHRDIKPANIILLEDDSVKIADFGIARVEESDLTQTGKVLGTPQYFSPEQALGKKTDARSDLYSAGLVLYELLTGERLITRKTEGTRIDRAAVGNIAKLDMYNTEQLKILKVIIARALATVPDTRFQTAADFNAALKPLAGSEAPGSDASSPPVWKWLAPVIAVIVLGGAMVAAQRLQLFDAISQTAKDITGTSPPTTLPPDDQEKVRRYLKTGQTHQLVGRLILPDGSSAYNAYKMALELDPRNADAIAGMETLQEKVLAQLEQLLDEGKTERARGILTRARKLFPDNRDFRKLEKTMGAKP